MLNGSKQLEYSAGEFLYRDIYFGMFYFIVQEPVYYKNEPIWSMSYSGGVDRKYDLADTKAIYAFLRKAMRQVTPDNPFRGPKGFIEGEYEFLDQNNGDLSQFIGNEKIIRRREQVYSLTYSGGYIR